MVASRKASRQIMTPQDGLLTGHTFAQMAINATSSVDPDYENSVTQTTSLKTIDTPHHSWARVSSENNTFDLSLCFMNPQVQDYEATAWERLRLGRDRSYHSMAKLN